METNNHKSDQKNDDSVEGEKKKMWRKENIGLILMATIFISYGIHKIPSDSSSEKPSGADDVPSVCKGNESFYPFLFVESAGVNRYTKKGEAMVNLIQGGNYTIERLFDKEGYCFGEIRIKGMYNGSSYDATLTGQLAG